MLDFLMFSGGSKWNLGKKRVKDSELLAETYLRPCQTFMIENYFAKIRLKVTNYSHKNAPL